MTTTTDYGMTDAGFILKPYEAVKDDVTVDFRVQFGNGINAEPRARFGQIIGILSNRYFSFWELLEAVYASAYRDSASGASLDNVGALTGTQRLDPSFSSVVITCCGTPGTPLTKGRTCSVAGVASSKFASAQDATIASVSAWIQSAISYQVGSLVTANGHVWRVTSNGIGIAGVNPGPTGTTDYAEPGTGRTFQYLGDGTGAVDVPFKATVTGPVAGPDHAITTIETPVSGWATALNLTSATLGIDVEVDSLYRLRQAEEQIFDGSGSAEAIRAALLRVSGVTSAQVFLNDTDATDGNGVPPHGIECVVLGGVDADIAACIWLNKGAGTRTYGSVATTTLDSQGNTQAINYSRPTQVSIYLVIGITKGVDWPSDGVTEVQNDVLAWAAANVGVGGKLIRSALFPVIFAVPGVADLTSLTLGTAPAPVGTSNLVATARQIFVLSSITVNVT